MQATAGFKLLMRVPAAALEIFETALMGLGGAVVRDPLPDASERPVVPLEVYLAACPERAEVVSALVAAAAAANLEPPQFEVEALPALDWIAESQKNLPPVAAGRFFLFAAHGAARRPAGAIALHIAAGQAFGTGHHESTRGSLLALDGLSRRVKLRSGLDLGSGSGVLAMAMAKLWRRLVLACDIDPLAVDVTCANARLNGLAPLIRAVPGDGPMRRQVCARRPYDVITANILAGPLCRMAGDLRRVLAPGGWLILSGLLRPQENRVLARYRAHGMVLDHRVRLGEWSTLVLRG